MPGGLGDTELQAELIEWLRAVHPTTTWTTSVCTGAIYLAAAGILDGVDATTHWARKRALEKLGAHYTTERVVERGKVITAAGVSSGIDMALVLLDRMHGPEMAQMIQLAIEYDPQPPFDAGSPAKAPAALVDLVQADASATAPRSPPRHHWRCPMNTQPSRPTPAPGCAPRGPPNSTPPVPHVRPATRSAEWTHLERAHILSQPMAGPHVRTHVAMLGAGAPPPRPARDSSASCFRIVVAAPGSLTGRYPVGNTGGADVSAFAPMPIPDDLRPLPDPTPRRQS